MSRLDPGIALNVRPPAAAQDPLEGYGKILNLKNSMQQGKINEQSLQMNDEQIKGAKMSNAAAERQAAAAKAMQDAIATNVKTDEATGEFSIAHDKVEAALVRAGFGDVALNYAKQKLDVENTMFDHYTKELDLASKKMKQFGAAAQSILNAPPELRPQVYSFTLKNLVSSKMVDQKALQESGISPEYKGEETDTLLQSIADAATEDPYGAFTKRMTETRAAAEERRKTLEEARKQTEFATKLPGARAESLKKQVETETQLLSGAKDPASWQAALGQLPEDRRKLYQTEFTPEGREKVAFMSLSPESRQKLSEFSSPTELAYAAQRGDKDAAAALKALEAREIRIETAKKMAEYNTLFGGQGALGAGKGPSGAVTLGELGQVNDEFLQTLAPAAASQVKALAEGRMAFPTGFALKSAYWQAMIDAVAKYDPLFDATNYNNRAKVRTDFTTGKSAQTINALATVVQHLGRLEKSIDGLGNFEGVPIFNKTANEFKNWLKRQGGDTKELNKFQADVQAVSSELVRAWRQAGGTEQDIQDWRKTMDASDSPSGLKASMAEMADLLEGKLLAMQNQLEQGLGKFADIAVIDPKTEGELNRMRGITTPVEEAAAPQAPAAPGKKITPQLMQQMRDLNKGVDDETIMKGLEAKGYAR